jgi:hypothetical protein
MEAIQSSETSVKYLHCATSQKTAFFVPVVSTVLYGFYLKLAAEPCSRPSTVAWKEINEEKGIKKRRAYSGAKCIL